jgi:hypothetical protein
MTPVVNDLNLKVDIPDGERVKLRMKFVRKSICTNGGIWLNNACLGNKNRTSSACLWNSFSAMLQVRGPFERFVDSPYYSESELCGGAVTDSFLKCLPWQAMHFLQRSHPLLENVLQTVCHKLQEDSGTGCFLASELPFHGWKSSKIAWGDIWIVRLRGWVLGFLIHFFQAEYRIQSRNADAPLRK